MALVWMIMCIGSQIQLQDSSCYNAVFAMTAWGALGAGGGGGAGRGHSPHD